MGNVIAEYSDYALPYQLVGDVYRESVGDGQRYTDLGLDLIVWKNVSVIVGIPTNHCRTDFNPLSDSDLGF